MTFKALGPAGSNIYVKDSAMPDELSDRILARFDADPRRTPGRVGAGRVDEKVKNSTDLYISDKADWQTIDREIFEALAADYKNFCQQIDINKSTVKADNDTGYNIQMYEPGGHYVWHNDCDLPEGHKRQLVFIYYLSDVEEGGETEFFYQEVSVKPKKGTLLLFPPFWTHAHRGAPVLKGKKYIVTGWFILG